MTRWQLKIRATCQQPRAAHIERKLRREFVKNRIKGLRMMRWLNSPQGIEHFNSQVTELSRLVSIPPWMLIGQPKLD